MKKKVITICTSLVLVAMMILSTACASNQATGTTATDDSIVAVNETEGVATTTVSDEKVKIGFSISDLNNPVWVAMYERMKEEAAKLGAELIVNDAKGDPNSQIDAIENFITAGCQTIIVHAFDKEASLPAINDAMAQGIKVLAYDVNLEGADIYCGLDNYGVGKAIGEAAGKWINDNLGGNAEVGICGYPTISIILERENGIVDGLMETAPNAKIVTTVTAGYTTEGVTEGENMMQAYPNINVVCGINDAGILGVYESFKAADYTGNDVALFGCDATDDALAAIKDGGIYKSTIALNTVEAGAKMIDAAYKAALGQEYPKEIIMEPTIVTVDNVDSYINK